MVRRDSVLSRMTWSMQSTLPRGEPKRDAQSGLVTLRFGAAVSRGSLAAGSMLITSDIEFSFSECDFEDRQTPKQLKLHYSVKLLRSDHLEGGETSGLGCPKCSMSRNIIIPMCL